MAGHASPPEPGTERFAALERRANEVLGPIRAELEAESAPLPATGTNDPAP